MKISLTLYLIVLMIEVYGQKEADVWLFDRDLGIDFNDSKFRAFNTTIKLNQEGASASICDETGKLLFFTNGRTVWDASFSVMKNGTGLPGGVFTHQAVLIVPVPGSGSGSKYYVFTTKSFNDPNPGGEAGMFYSVVDTEAGEVIQAQKNTMLTSNSSDKLIAIPNANHRDYWLIGHEGNSDKFLVFPVTADGVGAPAVFSFGLSYDYFKSRGWLQASPDGTMLACAVSSDGFEKNPIEWFDFDATTGVISNRRVLGLYPELTGVSFSPDNSKLYFTYSDQLNDAKGGLVQMDIGKGDLDAVQASATNLYALHDPFPGIDNQQYDTIRDGVLQLAPDGRLYLKAIVQGKIYFIDQPNLPGFLCKPMGRDFPVNFTSANGWAFPNFMPHYFNGLTPADNSGNDCEEDVVVYPNPTENTVNITFAGCSEVRHLSLFNTAGQRVAEYVITSPFYTVDLRNLAAGMYLFLFDTGGRRISRKIVKK